MKKLVAASIAALICGSAFAADSYSVDSRHTFPSFEVNHLGFSTQRGRFNVTSGKIVLDRKAKSGSVEVSIDTASIDTGLDKLEEHLRGADFFNTSVHPKITFKSSALTFNGDALTKVTGNITMLGVSKPLTLNATHFRCGTHPMLKREVCGANLSGSLQRSDFGMKYGLPAVGDEIRLLIQVEAINDAAPAAASQPQAPQNVPPRSEPEGQRPPPPNQQRN
ncbi:MAG: polyisoprenoid-binding protein [Betaproteobacteria bacterium]|nr:polyisoprenoid-binding protein [Betaproteobacteria bacterium]